MAMFESLSVNISKTVVLKGKYDAAGLLCQSCSNFLPLEVEIGIYLWDRAFSPILTKLLSLFIHVAVEKIPTYFF